MVWKPGNSPQLDLGEIPHKREISDTELANMRAHAPDRDLKEAADEYAARQQEILDGIVSDGDDAVDALTLINDLQGNEEFGVGPDVIAEDFSEKVETKLEELKSPLDFDVVMDVWYKKELSSSMFYFGISTRDDIGAYIILVSIPYWEEHKCLDDRDLEAYVAPAFLSRIMEAQYEIIGKSPSKARRELISLGFVENHDIIT